MAKPADPLRPLPSEASYYLSGDPSFALRLYAQRIFMSDEKAELKMRQHLTSLGFKELPEAVFSARN